MWTSRDVYWMDTDIRILKRKNQQACPDYQFGHPNIQVGTYNDRSIEHPGLGKAWVCQTAN